MITIVALGSEITEIVYFIFLFLDIRSQINASIDAIISFIYAK